MDTQHRGKDFHLCGSASTVAVFKLPPGTAQIASIAQRGSLEKSKDDVRLEAE